MSSGDVKYLPESTAYIPLRRIDAVRNGTNSETLSATLGLLVKRQPKKFLKTRKTIATIKNIWTVMHMEVIYYRSRLIVKPKEYSQETIKALGRYYGMNLLLYYIYT